MNDNLQANSNALEAVRNAVDGYEGYEAGNQRERSDAAFRQVMVDAFREVSNFFNGGHQPANVAERMRFENLSTHVVRSLTTILNSLETPTYINTSFFTNSSPPNYIGRIYELEDQVLKFTSGIKEEGQNLFDGEISADVFEDDFMRIIDSIDSINQALFEREALISGDMY